MGNLNVYECRRHRQEHSWAGALVVAAKDTHQANQLCASHEPWRALPAVIIEWQGVTASGPPRVLYNDEMR